MTQSANVFGTGAVIVQIQGDGNSVVSGRPHLKLLRRSGLWRRIRQDPSSGKPYELDLISPFARAIDVIGREKELSDLRGWLAGNAPISVRVLTGGSGIGKTRLAVELIEEKLLEGWRAGFLERNELARFLEQHDLSNWQWNASVLVVIDHASTFSHQLHAWLTELADSPALRDIKTGPSRPLRFLLLDRKAKRRQGWWEEVVGIGSDAAVLEQFFDPPRPLVLSPLDELQDRRAIFSQTFEKLNSGLGTTTVEVDEDFECHLTELPWGGVPLLLMLAATTAAHAGFRPVLAVTASNLVLAVAENELARIKTVVTSRGVNPEIWPLVQHVIAVVTLRRGVKVSQTIDLIKQEARELGYVLPAGPAPIWSALSQALPDSDAGIAVTEVDLVSEALLLSIWNNSTEASESVLRAFRQEPSAVAETIIRICQHFEMRERPEPIKWLNRIIDECSDAESLMYVAKALPDDTVELREVAVRVSKGLVDTLRTITNFTDDASAQIELGMALVSFANRLYWAGQQEDALTIAQEGAAVFRRLSDDNEMYSRNHLAVALSNVSGRLADHGLRNEALSIAQEAVALHREVAARSPNGARASLARAMNNLSLRLLDMGQANEALTAIQETVTSYRELNSTSSGRFRGDVAGSLINLASILSKDAQFDAALAAIEESVELYRQLVAERPDAYKEYLGGALNVLTPILVDMGRENEAHDAISEAVDIFRDLVRPGNHMFDNQLAMSLHNFGILLGKISKKQEGVAALEKCVIIRRKLAGTNPQIFSRDLAASLRQLSVQLVSLGRTQDAVDSIEEAVGLVIGGFLDKQDAYTAEMISTVQFYYQFCKETGVDPDSVLLDPLAERLRRLQKDSQRGTEE